MFKRISVALLLSVLLLFGLKSALRQERPVAQALQHEHPNGTFMEEADENSSATADKSAPRSPDERVIKERVSDLLSADARTDSAMAARERYQHKRAYQLAYKQARRSWQRAVQSARLAGDTERLEMLRANRPDKDLFKNSF